jgi:hypothetical protein
MSQPHILTIPREIRDLIYSYLHHPVSVGWKVDRPEVCCAMIEVQKAPFPNVLLTCSRFKEEYLESSVYADLDAVIRTVYESDDDYELTYGSSHGGYPGIDCQMIEGGHPSKLTSLFGRIKHVSLLVNDLRWRSDLGRVQFRSTLSMLCPSLMSAKICIYEEGDADMDNNFSLRSGHGPHELAVSAQVVLPITSPQFCDLPLAQK